MTSYAGATICVHRKAWFPLLFSSNRVYVCMPASGHHNLALYEVYRRCSLRTSGRIFDISSLEYLIESILACQLHGVFCWCFNTYKVFYTERSLVACSNRVSLCNWVYLCMPASGRHILALKVVEVFYIEHLAVNMFEKNISSSPFWDASFMASCVGLLYVHIEGVLYKTSLIVS